jgi:beta-glucosidase
VREDAQGMVVVGHHLLLTHGLANPRLRAGSAAGTRVGAALNLFPVFAGEPGSASVEAVERADRFHNRWFLDPLYRGEYPPHLFEQLGAAPPPIQDGDMGVIRTPTDFLGVNYYNRIVVRGSMRDALAWSANGVNGVNGVAAESNGRGAAVAVDYITDLPGAERTAKGWEVYPHGLTLVLEELHRAYHPPALLITENGAAFDDVVDESGHVSDPARVAFLRQHVEAVATAVGHGVPVAGYLVWSLFDNFEWEDGYSKRFGLIYVDYATQRRIIKDSGRWYAGLIADQRALRVG